MAKKNETNILSDEEIERYKTIFKSIPPHSHFYEIQNVFFGNTKKITSKQAIYIGIDISPQCQKMFYMIVSGFMTDPENLCSSLYRTESLTYEEDLWEINRYVVSNKGQQFDDNNGGLKDLNIANGKILSLNDDSIIFYTWFSIFSISASIIIAYLLL